MLVVYSALPPSEAFPKAQAAAEKALEIDDTLAEAHASLAYIKFQWSWNWTDAETEFKRALNLKPGYAAGHQWYSNYLAAVGRFDEAMAEAQRTRELEPTSLITNAHLGWIYYLARRYDESISQAERAIKLDPNFFPGQRYLGLSYAGQGKYEAAIAAFQKAVALSQGSALMKAELGHAYAAAGKRDEAQKTIDELQAMAKQRHISPHYFALIYAGLGEKDRAFEWLNRAYEERAERLVWLKVDPRLDNLRSDPRFTELLRRISLAP
jgi:tetratricopeptide (TPR) repeat protein